MLPSWLTQDLVPDITCMLADSSLSAVFACANILHQTFFTSDTINDPLGLAIELPLDLDNNPSSSGFHHPHFKNKTAHRTSSALLVTSMHSIQNSSFSQGGWSGNSSSDKLASEIPSNFVGNERRGREYFT